MLLFASFRLEPPHTLDSLSTLRPQISTSFPPHTHTHTHPTHTPHTYRDTRARWLRKHIPLLVHTHNTPRPYTVACEHRLSRPPLLLFFADFKRFSKLWKRGEDIYARARKRTTYDTTTVRRRAQRTTLNAQRTAEGRNRGLTT